jgi:hypothetical protein
MLAKGPVQVNLSPFFFVAKSFVKTTVRILFR